MQRVMGAEAVEYGLGTAIRTPQGWCGYDLDVNVTSIRVRSKRIIASG